MRHVILTVIGSLLTAAPAATGKPPASPPNPEIAYRFFGGNSNKLIVANENGTNASSLYSSTTAFRFDLAPRAQRQIAIIDGPANATVLKLLTYAVNGSGVFVTTNVEVLGPARSGSYVDFSPDGTKIAYACCSDGENEQLVVHDLTNNSKTAWGQSSFYWDISWYRNGNSIAYATLQPLEIRELTSPGASPQLLYSHGQGQLYIDSARTNGDRLVISYSDANGSARVGLWQPGGFVISDLANSARSWQGTLNCNDTKLAYMGVQNTSGSQAFYIRNLGTGQTSLVSKESNILLQFWPTC